MANTTTRGRGRKAEPKPQPKAEPEAAQQPEPQQAEATEQPKPAKGKQPKEYAKVRVEAIPVTYYRPAITIVTPQPDGSETIFHVTEGGCPHRYLHEHEKAAIACGRRIASQRGLTDVRA